MRVKYQGAHPVIRVRHIVFEAGKIVTLDDDNAADMALARKVLAWPDMTEVKAGRPRKNGKKLD